MSSTFVDDPRDRAFERLYERYVREVYRYVFAVLRNPAEAEDVTQTTFLNAYRAIQAGAEPQRPHNWLIAIAHNACRSRVRFAMRRPKEVPLDDLVEQLAVPESERLNVRELLRALGRLPFNQRAALTMRELEGRTYPEIAETLGVTVPAVEALIARARKSLRVQAAAFRGLAAIQLPRSLRKLLEPGDAAGSVIGGGAVAKAAAMLAAGVVASSVGSAPTVDAQTPERAVVTARVVQQHTVVRRSPAAPVRRHSATPRARPGTAAKHVSPAPAAVLPHLSPEATESPAPTQSAAAPAATPAPPPAASAGPSPAAPPPTVQTTVENTVASVPQPPPLPVELPALPDPPPLPNLPAPPPLPVPVP
jgi:RNA polymerase sigma factor (sigma-70 family)